MKERADDVQLKPSGPRKFCADINVLKTEEWKRRRLLRLEQVRQQSKDIASDIRRKVWLEKNYLSENYQKRNKVAVAQWKEQKLTALQNELTQTLSYVGSAHKQAECESKQEEAKQELKIHHVEAADRRGREAILRLRSDELARKQVNEARKLQQQHSRSVEGVRSAVVVSLPVPKSTVPVGNAAHVRKAAALKKEKSVDLSHRQWPSKAWPLSIPLGVTPADIDGTVSNRTNNSAKSTVLQHNTLDCRPLNQDSETVSITVSENKGILPGKTSNSTASSKTTDSRARKKISNAPKIDTEPKEVELYDYTNGSHVQYIKPSAVSESIPVGLVDGYEAAEACASIPNVKQDLSLSAKRIERGRKAIKRVQTKREYQTLLSELAGLVRQQAAIHSFVPSKPEERQKLQEKLNDAVIDVLNEPSGPEVVKKNSEFKRTELVSDYEHAELLDRREENETIVDVCSQDETIVDVCVQDETNVPLDNLKEEKVVEKRTLESNEMGRKIPEQKGQFGATIREAKSFKRKSFEKTLKEESFSSNETRMSTSFDSDVPKLNLALWTSRSPESSEEGNKTLTPLEKQKETANSSGSPGDKTLTPSTQRDESKSTRRSSTSPSSASAPTSPPVTEEKMKTAPSKREKPLSRNEKLTLKGLRGNATLKSETRNSKPNHVGSGDYISVPERSNHPRQKSPELLPKGNDPELESDTPRQPLFEERRKRSKKVSPSSSGSTSYMSLPNKLLSAITQDLRSLLSLTRRRKAGDGLAHSNPLLAHYINRLLDMSRQSVERLNVVTSEVPTPPSAVFRNLSDNSSSRRSISLSACDPVESGISNGTVNHGDFSSSTKTSDLSSSSGNSSELVSVMRQCHARISSLSQMIEQVRKENAVSTPVENRISPSLHLDSTAYLSPPPTVLPSSQLLLRNSEEPCRSNPMDDTYASVVTRLVSEIRLQLAKEAEKPLQINLTPPRGSEKNKKSPSSNELSTIPEQDTSSLEWSSVVISSETGNSSEDVEKEFSRMGLGWAGTTLRKTKEAGTLDSNSSSDLLELSALSLFGSYSHSTPIKTADEKWANTSDNADSGSQ